MKRSLVGCLFAVTLSTSAHAQDLGMSFDDAVYTTCRDAQAMPRETRVAFAVALVERAATHLGVPYAEGSDLDKRLGPLIRAGCTVYPDAYVHSVVTAAFVRAANAPLQPISAWPIPFEQAVYLTCQDYGRMSDEQQDAVEFDLAVRAGQHYGMEFEDSVAGRTQVDQGITPLVQSTCVLTPEFLIYAVVARAVKAAVDVRG